MHNPADLLTKAVDQATLDRLLWSTGVSRLDAPEIAEVTTAGKKNMVHVKRHLSAFIVASVLAGAAGYEEDDEQEDMNQGWSVKTLILFFLFYGAYFGIIIGAWGTMKFGVQKLLSWIGLESKKPRTRTMGINTEVAAEAAPLLPTAAATAVNTATNGCINITTLAGQKYHTRRNCGHIIGRDQKKLDKCLDCRRLDLYD